MGLLWHLDGNQARPEYSSLRASVPVRLTPQKPRCLADGIGNASQGGGFLHGKCRNTLQLETGNRGVEVAVLVAMLLTRHHLWSSTFLYCITKTLLLRDVTC